MKIKLFIFMFLLTFLSMNSGTAFAQTQKIVGSVLDAQGEPLIGAAIVQKGTNNATVTDANGKFTLTGVKQNAVLEVSFVGMETKLVKATPNLKIVLKENLELDEVLVVAFGEQKRSAFTGSASVVGATSIEQRQVTNVTDALQGRVAGLQSISSSGSPDSTPTIRVRGIGSINAGKDPLIIVDGVPFDGGLNNVNPADIETVTVQKDAASNALYGARGANGVIMITTKKGKAGNAVVTFDAKWGCNQRATQDYSTIKDPAMYLETYYTCLKNYYQNVMGNSPYEAHANANATMYCDSNKGGLGYIPYSVPEGQYLIGDNGKLNPNATLGNRVTNNGVTYTILPDDWTKECYRQTLRQEYNFNVTAGTDRSSFYASLGYLNNEGIVYGSDYERVTARMKADYQIKPWLKIGGNANYTHYVRNGVDETSTSTNSFYMAATVGPIYPLYLRDENGNIMFDSNGKMYDYGGGDEHGLRNPVLSNANQLKDDQLNTMKSVGNSFYLSGFTEITPLPGLKITLNGNITDNEYRYTSTQNPYYGFGAITYPNGYVSIGHYRTYTQNYQQLINYTHTFGTVHNMTLLAGHENYKYNYQYVWGSRSGMYSYKENQELSGAIIVESDGSSNSDYNTEGYFARGMYDYDGKYFFSASYRRDASSRFAVAHRWGNFYSVGAAWNITKEKWFDCDAFDMLKFKVSYGEQGNDDIGSDETGYYKYEDTYNIVNSDNNIALSLNEVGNEKISWETVGEFNAGFEFDMFKSRLKGSVEYYSRNTTDMLCKVKVPLSLGYSGYWSNVGDMYNRGIEIDVNGDIIKTADFNWNVGFNIAFNKNKITKLQKDNKTATLDGYKGYVSGYHFYGEDLPIYSWRLLKYAGVTSEGVSQWYVKNSDGTLGTTTNPSDASYFECGTALADATGGFNTSVNYKGFDFSMGFSYSIGGKVLDYGYADLMCVPYSSNVGKAMHKDMLNAWSESNATSNIPRLQYGDQYTSEASDRFLTNGSWLSLQNINLGYTLPNKMIRTLGLTKLRLYVAVDGVAYWTHRKGMDPRTTFSGYVYGTNYAQVRTYTGGITLQF